MEVLDKVTNLQEAKEAIARKAPYNILAEQVLLGAILSDNETINQIGDYLLPEHFYEPVHVRIFQSINMLLDRGMLATPITLKGLFDKDPALQDLGGAEYLAHMASIATTIVNIRDYGKVVYDLALRRKLIKIGEEIVNDAFDNEIDLSANEQIEKAEQYLFNIASEGVAESGFMALRDSLSQSIRRISHAHAHSDQLTGISTGFIDLDESLFGMQNSDLIILAARPSMGKTALAVNMAVNAAKYLVDNHKDVNSPVPSIGFFSLEMSSEQLATRILSMESGIESGILRSGKFPDKKEFTKLGEHERKLLKLPLFIDDTPALSIGAIRTRARRLKRKNNLAVLFIDYLQLIRGSTSTENRVQEITQITQGLKAIAKELNIPVIALSQLSRSVEQREDKRPQLSDLRESGSIEQDADVVMFIYRDEYYLERKKPPEHKAEEYAKWYAQSSESCKVAEIAIAKQRNGPIGTVKLHFNGAITKFDNLSKR
jgi:replicative DNA helicase